eukprot:SAG31_NODE_7223_length_1750_cov_2.334343_1_plen_89_part_00
MYDGAVFVCLFVCLFVCFKFIYICFPVIVCILFGYKLGLDNYFGFGAIAILFFNSTGLHRNFRVRFDLLGILFVDFAKRFFFVLPFLH